MALHLDDRVVDTRGALEGTTPFTALRVTAVHHAGATVDVTEEQPELGTQARTWTDVKPADLLRVDG